MAASPFEQLRALADRLTTAQKIRLAVAGVVAAGALWGIALFAGRIRYEVLFSNLEPEDASMVVAKLQESKVDYRIEGGGSAISVPTDRVAALRLSLAGEGIPRGGGIGFEIFDRSSFDISDFVQNVNYQRALERELGRTIEGLAAVSKARVHLVLPERALFADEGREAKGSVVVRLFRGRELRADETLAIAHLVSSAVRGLSPERVSVVDADGRMLRDGQGDDSVQTLTSRQLEVKSSFERDLQTRLVALLTPIVGDGKVRARVDATLDFQTVQRVEERYDADGAVIRSEKRGKQTRRSGSAPVGGPPGSTANLPEGTDVAEDRRQDTDESTDSTINYEIPKTVATITEPVGDVKRLSVAVVVDNAARAASAEAGGDAAAKTAARSDEEMKKLTELARAAVGFDESRGDVLTVANLPFDTGPIEEQKQALGSAERREFWFGIAKWPSLVIGALLFFLLVLRPLARWTSSVVAPAPALAPPATATATLEAGTEAPALALRRRLAEISAGEPEGAAEVVRTWLRDRRN